MAGPGSSQDIAARDDAHLRSLGIKPELQRTLGFLSNFAIAFSFISVSTGIVHATSASAIGVGGPAFFWSWPIVIARPDSSSPSNFAELASHFPVAGSIYQWSKRLSQPDARLVHRLDLLLGAGRDRHRGRGHRPARRVDGIHGRRRLASSTRRSDRDHRRCSRSSSLVDAGHRRR